MKSLAIAAGAFLVVPLAGANAAVFTLGGPNSRLCFDAADTLDDRPSAIEGCTNALVQDPLNDSDRAATHVNRGILNMISGHERDAEADFSKAIELDARLADAWLNKGFLKLRQNRGGEALALIEEGMKRQPRRQALAIFARGLAHEQVGDFGAAYRDLQAARDLEPEWALPSRYLARYRVRGN